jgi:hypothetical protein
MPVFEEFRMTRFRPAALARIEQANEIIEEYSAAGYVLTLRQLYYQFVSRDLIKNTEREYKNLGNLISKGRLAGMIDWRAIEDRTRSLRYLPSWDSPAEIVRSSANQYHVDMWEGQDRRPEVWIEKEALAGVIAPICRELDVAYFACKGYVSQSEQWEAGVRIRQRVAQYDQDTVILHLGDHDPSGMDMTRDNDDRLSMFSWEDVEVRRLALNMDQIEQYNPPPNPAKTTDARAASYIAHYGESSWELDALEPSVMVDMIRTEIESLIDPEIMHHQEMKQTNGRRELRVVADQMENGEME